MRCNLSIILVLLNLCYSEMVLSDSEIFSEGIDARNTALGGLSISYYDGLNPTLIKNKQSSIHFSYREKYNDKIKVTSLSYLFFVDKHPYFINLINRTISDIPDTRSAWDDNGDLIPDYHEINYFKINNINQTELGLQLSTISIYNRFTLGFKLKTSMFQLAEYKSYGVGSDIAILYEINKLLNINLNFLDLISTKYWNTNRWETLMPLIKLGFNIDFDNFVFGVESSKYIKYHNLSLYNIGLEYQSANSIFYRIGASHNTKISLGLGFKLSVLNIDYAYIQPAKKLPFDNNHILSLGISLKEISRIKDKIKP